jgi:hypothetical protein
MLVISDHYADENGIIVEKINIRPEYTESFLLKYPDETKKTILENQKPLNNSSMFRFFDISETDLSEKTVLLNLFGGLGDLVCLSCLPRIIKSVMPKIGRLCVAIPPNLPIIKELYSAIPQIDGIICYPVFDVEKYDFIVPDFTQLPKRIFTKKSVAPLIKIALKNMGISWGDVDILPDVYLDYRKLERKAGRSVVVAPFSSVQAKSLPKVFLEKNLIDFSNDYDRIDVIVGDSESFSVSMLNLPDDVMKKIRWVRAPTLHELASCLLSAELAFVVDSFVLHMAMGLRVPTVAVFFVTHPEAISHYEEVEIIDFRKEIQKLSEEKC